MARCLIVTATTMVVLVARVSMCPAVCDIIFAYVTIVLGTVVSLAVVLVVALVATIVVVSVSVSIVAVSVVPPVAVATLVFPSI